MKITGELLKSERINKSLSIQDVAYALKLHPKMITAIEAGDLSELPSKTFVRGFVKGYSDYLKLNTEDVLKQFQEEMGHTFPVPKSASHSVGPLTHELSNKSSKAVFQEKVESVSGARYEDGLNKNNIKYFVIVTALVVTIAVLNKVISSYQNEVPQAQNSELQSDITVSSETSNQAPLSAEASVSGTIAAGTIPSSATAEIALDAAIVNSSATGSVIQPITNSNESVVGTNKAETNAGNSEAKSINSNLTPLERSSGQSVEVVLEAKKDATIEYAKGNTTDFKKILLKANTVQILKSSSGLHLRSLEAQNVNLIVNGVNKGLMSSSSKSNNNFSEITF